MTGAPPPACHLPVPAPADPPSSRPSPTPSYARTGETLSLLHRHRTGSGGDRWNTLGPPPRAKVLGVARNLTSATRVLDVMRLLRREDGIEKYYTVNPGSVFAEGLAEYLHGVGVHVLTWQEARRRSFDLAVACSVHPTMRKIDAPLMVLPHGAGYNRLVRESTGDSASPAGLSRRELMHRRKVVPAAIGVSHESQLSRLAETCPEAVPLATLVGDWCLQRIQDSWQRRDLYRERLGAVGGRRLVVVHSTWSEHSLLGRHPRLPLDLVTALPVDEFVVAAVLHPNVWARHGRDGVLERLEKAMDAGLLLIPPQEGWRAAVVASDWVVGDHGSTSFYSAAVERVTVLAATGLDELDPASPAADFGRRAPRLDAGGDLYAQLARAAGDYDPGQLRAIVEEQFSDVGGSGVNTRRRMYEFLAEQGIGVPRQPPHRSPVPAPEPLRNLPPTVFDVTGDVAADGAVRVRRWPVVPEHHEENRGFFAVTGECGPGSHFPQSAEVVARTVVGAEPPAEEWFDRQAALYPAFNVLAASLGAHECLVRLRGGPTLEAHADRGFGEPRPILDAVLLGAALNIWRTHHWASPARTPSTLTLVTGSHRRRVVFTRRP